MIRKLRRLFCDAFGSCADRWVVSSNWAKCYCDRGKDLTNRLRTDRDMFERQEKRGTIAPAVKKGGGDE